MTMIRLAAWVLLTCLPWVGMAQGGTRPVPLQVSFFNEATAIPFTKLLTWPVHPGVQVGTDFDYKVTAKSRLFQTANLSYYYHGQLNRGIGLHTELSYEYRSRLGLAGGALLGIGYLHTFATTKEYAFQGGQYVERTDIGNARLYPSLSLDLGYYLAKDDVRSPKVFVRYQAWAEYPYSPGFIPVMTHINLHLGIRCFLFQSKSADEKD
jgi:hypothetical protein